jgi:hypothetical protein
MSRIVIVILIYLRHKPTYLVLNLLTKRNAKICCSPLWGSAMSTIAHFYLQRQGRPPFCYNKKYFTFPGLFILIFCSDASMTLTALFFSPDAWNWGYISGERTHWNLCPSTFARELLMDCARPFCPTNLYTHKSSCSLNIKNINV